MKDQALDYVKRGWFVLPLAPKEKLPYFPFAKNGYKSATNNLELVDYWWSKVPNLNIGIACDVSNLVVLDVDFRNGGSTDNLKDTYKVKTGNGFHFYYATSGYPVLPIKQGIDVKYKGYVVAPPSVHPNGDIYTYAGGQLTTLDARNSTIRTNTKRSSVSLSIFEGLTI